MGKGDDKCGKKSNVLVYNQPAGEKRERKCENSCKNRYKPPICKPMPKPIRVCTGADMKRMCAPEPCICAKPKSASHGGSGSGILRLFKFGIKSAIAAAAIYVTYDMGIWGTADDTDHLCKHVCTILGVPNIRPNHRWDHPACEAESDLFEPLDPDPMAHCKKPPVSFERATFNLGQCWNNAVTCFFTGLANFPHIMACRDANYRESGGSQEEEFEVIEQKKCVPMSFNSDDPIENEYKK